MSETSVKLMCHSVISVCKTGRLFYIPSFLVNSVELSRHRPFYKVDFVPRTKTLHSVDSI